MKVKELNNDDYFKYQSAINSELNLFLNFSMFIIILSVINFFSFYIGSQSRTIFIINSIIIIILAVGLAIMNQYLLFTIRKRFNITSGFTLFKKKNNIPPSVLNDFEEFKKFQEFKNKNLEIKKEIDVLKQHDYSDVPIVEIPLSKTQIKKTEKENKKVHGF